MTSVVAFAAGKVASAVNAVSSFYMEINPATLSGASDIIVVQDGEELRSSPFYVRFGKFKLLRPQEKIVEVRVNRKITGLRMRVNELGEAFFDSKDEEDLFDNTKLSTNEYSEKYDKAEDSIKKNLLDPEEISYMDEYVKIYNRSHEYEQLRTWDTSQETVYASLYNSKIDDFKYQDDIVLETVSHRSRILEKNRRLSVPELPTRYENVSGDQSTHKSIYDFFNKPNPVKSHDQINESSIENADSIQLECGSNMAGYSPVIDSAKLNPLTLGDESCGGSSINTPTFKSNTSDALQNKHGSNKDSDIFSIGSLIELLFKNRNEKIEISAISLNTMRNLPESEVDTEFNKNILNFDATAKLMSTFKDEGNADLVVKVGKAYIDWRYLANSLIIQLVFNKSIPESLCPPRVMFVGSQKTLLKDQGDKSPVNSKGYISRLWHSFDRKSQRSKKGPAKMNSNLKRNNSSKKTLSDSRNKVKKSIEKPIIKSEKRLCLSSNEIKQLGLAYGANEITFTVKNQGFQGVAICTAKIFLWSNNDKVVISDIDGTITKSDALGHILPMVGKDWTHMGVVDFYSNIHKNGYKILYLTSRSLGQASYTREYIDKVRQGDSRLPEGPIIMSPDRLFTSLRREIILKKPEEFKISCLRRLRRLFGNSNPFYAGFGNKITDALSYRGVDVPVSRIFTINSYGEVRHELLLNRKLSYIRLNDLVDQIFPHVEAPNANMPEYNDWNFWRSRPKFVRDVP